MLKLLKDSRTGSRLEVIIPVYNEQERIKRILNAYEKICDLVFIDDNSIDSTIDILLNCNCTIYIRNRNNEPISLAPTEVPIVYYINNLSLSKKCLKIDADEVFPINYIKSIYNELNYFDIILGLRIDVLNGKPFNFMNAIFPIAFKSGSVTCLNQLHAAIQPIENQITSTELFKIYHLDIVIESSRAGKLGKYVNSEIERLKIYNIFSYNFFRRFVIPMLTFIFRKIFKINYKYFFYFLYKYFIDLSLAILILNNKKLVNDETTQKISNERFFNKVINNKFF